MPLRRSDRLKLVKNVLGKEQGSGVQRREKAKSVKRKREGHDPGPLISRGRDMPEHHWDYMFQNGADVDWNDLFARGNVTLDIGRMLGCRK